MTSTSIRVLIADDQALVRSGFVALLEGSDGFDVVGEASTGSEAVDCSFSLCPDVVLMDIRMPGMDGIAATERITADGRLVDVHVLVLTTFDLDQYVYSALRAGASGFLLKDTAPKQLLHAIRTVHEGDALISPSITRRLISEFVARPGESESSRLLEHLTGREREVLAEVGRGSNNAEIGTKLFISPLTVKTHVSRIMGKLNARDRAQLVVAAYESGLVSPGS